MNMTTVCSETSFSKNSFHTETSQLICIANQMTGFYMIQVLTKRYFQTNFSLVKHVIDLMQIMLSKSFSQSLFFRLFFPFGLFFVNNWSGYILKHFKLLIRNSWNSTCLIPFFMGSSAKGTLRLTKQSYSRICVVLPPDWLL